MLDQLEYTLRGLATPQQIEMITEACQTLDTVDFRDYEGTIEQMIAAEMIDPSNLTFAIIEECLIPMYRELLKRMGVTLTSEATLNQYNEAAGPKP